MRNRVLALATAAVAASVAVIGLSAQSAAQDAGKTAVPPTVSPSMRTPWGHPDLQGTWDYRTITPLERAAALGNREFYTVEEIKTMEARAAKRMDEAPEEGAPAGTVHPTYWTDPGRFVDEQRRTSLIVDPPNGRIPPLTTEAQARGGRGGRGGGGANARQGGRADSWLDRTVLERCIAWGLPTALLPGLYNNNIRIVQTPDTVVIVHEMVHDARVIPLDGRPQPPATMKAWMGSSRGRWEGDTLVVETTNFTDKISYRGATSNIKLTERYRRVGPQAVEMRLTVEDPATWTQPWTAKVNMRPAEGELYEYACHEGNYGLRNILEVARDEEKAAAEAAAKSSK